MAATDGSEAVGERKLKAPRLFLMLAEARSIFELNSSLLLSPLLLRAPKGDGHPVLTLPGFLASDLSMAPMRRYLRELGHDTYAWQMGRNIRGVSRTRAALQPFPGAAGYVTAKAGVIAFAQAVAVEYRDEGVRCNALLPSVIDTPGNRAAMPQADFGKWVAPAQLAATIAFLCSDDGAATSGAAIPVYGRA